jgi:hypothetical protein
MQPFGFRNGSYKYSPKGKYITNRDNVPEKEEVQETDTTTLGWLKKHHTNFPQWERYNNQGCYS